MSKHKHHDERSESSAQEAIPKSENINQPPAEEQIPQDPATKEDPAQQEESNVKKEAFFKKLLEKSAGEGVEKLKKEVDDVTALLQRNQAEFLNFKKRTEKEKEELKYLANEKLMKDLLTTLDNFERALEAFEEKDSSMYKGVELICKQLWDTMAKHGASLIDNEIPFDPGFHHAVMQEEGGESGHIAKVLQKGYMLKDRVLRPSMVSVYQ